MNRSYNLQMRTILLGLFLLAPLSAQDHTDRSDLSVVGRIKAEAFDNSQVMDTLQYLTDQYGPRLTASPEFMQAADWTVKRLQSYGIENVHMEKWGPFGRSWSLKQYSVEMLEPRYALLVAAPLAWSDNTRGTKTGEITITQFGTGRRNYDPAQLEADINKYMTEWKGKLKGKIIMLSGPKEIKPDAAGPDFIRYTDKDLAEMAQAPSPSAKSKVDLKNLKFPDDPEEMRRFYMSLPSSVTEKFFDRRTELRARFSTFLKQEGVIAILDRDDRARDGRLNAESAGSYKAKDSMSPARFIVTGEQYNRMARLVEKKVPVRVRVNLEAEISKDDQDAYNIVGEIPGGSKKDEVVMIGGHFDSWHTGTGATDNGAGSAVMMEAMRVLKTLNVKLDRTVRIALWSGEEEGLLGSKAYVKEHFGDPDTMRITGAHAKLAGYFNLDNGSGKIRGAYLQGNDAMRPIFESWFTAFRDQGVSTVTIKNTGGTDHLSFDAVGLPGFQFIQDPLDYETLTHHSDIDTYDHLQAPDLMQAAAVIATVVYNAANRPDMLPRKELPKAQPRPEPSPVTATGTN